MKKIILFLVVVLPLLGMGQVDSVIDDHILKPVEYTAGDNDTLSDTEIYEYAEQAPEFPGGRDSLFRFFENNLQSPDTGISGRVLVIFIVEKNGNISNVKIMRSLNEQFDKETIRVVKLMPNWKPARQNGKPVRMRFSMPVKF